MKYPTFFDPKNTLSLFCLQDKLNFLISLYKNSNLSLKEYLGSKEIKISVGKKKIGILKIL